MEINKNQETHTISVWLTKADQQDEELQNWLKNKIPAWKKEGYMTVVYRSGKEDLHESILARLKHNRKLSAQNEVAAEKKKKRSKALER